MSHYDWLLKNLRTFFDNLGLDSAGGNPAEWLNPAHGDKCYSYRRGWAEHGIPFPHGVALYYLTYIAPYSKESRQTDGGWMAPDQWVIGNYERFRAALPACELESVGN